MQRIRLVTKHESLQLELAVNRSERIRPRMMQLQEPQEMQEVLEVQQQARKKRRKMRRSIPI
jgi:hypothetical protein